MKSAARASLAPEKGVSRYIVQELARKYASMDVQTDTSTDRTPNTESGSGIFHSEKETENINMTCAMIFGADLFLHVNGVLKVEDNGILKEFFKFHEVDRARSLGSYLVVDCDIKDSEGTREVKLKKSRLVGGGTGLQVQSPGKDIEIQRDDGSTIIKLEELDPETALKPFEYARKIPKFADLMDQVELVLRLTGDFHAGAHHVVATGTSVHIGNAVLAGNLFAGSGGGITLSASGFSLG